MRHLIIYRISAVLLAIGGGLGHTVGGMLGTASRGPQAGPEADLVMSQMRAVHFLWRGANSDWFDWWMGNGLSVSALLLPVVVVLWVLGRKGRQVPLPIAWATFIGLTLLATIGFVYFGSRIGAVFALVALLTGTAVVLDTVTLGRRRPS